MAQLLSNTARSCTQSVPTSSAASISSSFARRPVLALRDQKPSGLPRLLNRSRGALQITAVYQFVPYTKSGELEVAQRPSLRGIYPRGSVAAVILGGGETDSRRLYPLTDKRTLPAIPVGGNYRLIDFSMSSLINSGVNKVYILTQYNSTSLNRYLTRTYDFQGGGIPFGGDGFMEVVAATQDPTSQRWAEGPVDTVRQFMPIFESTKNRFIEDLLILPSDQIYRMDFSQVVNFHRQNLADLTIVCRQVLEQKAENLGIVKVDDSSRVTEFFEKPKGDKMISMSMDEEDITAFLESRLVPLKEHDPHPWARAYIGSCGIYLFKREVLIKMLRDNRSVQDFGRELIPKMIEDGYKVMAYNFPGYWSDIGGSISDFYEGNMDLCKEDAEFKFPSLDQPIFTSPTNLPPNRVDGSKLRNSLLGVGCKVENSVITNSVIGSRSFIGSGCNISHSIVMGADYYESEKEWRRSVGPNYPHIGIGAGSTLRKVIADKNARIGQNCQLVNKDDIRESFDRIKSGICVRDGIIVIAKSSVVPDNTVI